MKISDETVTHMVDRIMARAHAASGRAVFVDPVVLRQIINEEWAAGLARAEARWAPTPD
jgi:hypothetical protein